LDFVVQVNSLRKERWSSGSVRTRKPCHLRQGLVELLGQASVPFVESQGRFDCVDLCVDLCLNGLDVGAAERSLVGQEASRNQGIVVLILRLHLGLGCFDRRGTVSLASDQKQNE
jgi:hypothetical protein